MICYWMLFKLAASAFYTTWFCTSIIWMHIRLQGFYREKKQTKVKSLKFNAHTYNYKYWWHKYSYDTCTKKSYSHNNIRLLLWSAVLCCIFFRKSVKFRVVWITVQENIHFFFYFQTGFYSNRTLFESGL